MAYPLLIRLAGNVPGFSEYFISKVYIWRIYAENFYISLKANTCYEY